MKGREGYFNIDPALRARKRAPILSKESAPLPVLSGGGAIQEEFVDVALDGLAILTVVSKWMGPLSQWKPHFQEAMERGYNMLHYTPLQQRGESQSPYSIADQMAYDNELFGPNWKGTDEEGLELVKETLKIAKEEFGLLSLTDVVLNHTANNSEWLLEHPEAGKRIFVFPFQCFDILRIGYSPLNSPHLTPALEIDDAIIEFSKSLKARGLPTILTSQADVDALIGMFHEELKSHNLWQYYVLDVAKERTDVKAALTDAPIWEGVNLAGKNVVDLANVIRTSGELDESKKFHSRFSVSVKPQVAASLIKAAFKEIEDEDALIEAWVRVVDVLNVPLYKEWEEDTRVALENIKNRLTYTRLADNGPKLGEITEE